jgi:PilZ domain-containing protein
MSAQRTESSSALGPEVAPTDRRQYQRFAGPFDGRRVGAIETPVCIYDMSRGGCFITSLHEQRPGVHLTLHIDLPNEGWVTLTAVTLPRQNEFGFAVRFIGGEPDSLIRFDRALKRLEEREPYGA